MMWFIEVEVLDFQQIDVDHHIEEFKEKVSFNIHSNDELK